MPVGFYGKLPSHGDFLRRRVSDAFVEAWDVWLREGIAASRAALGHRWLDVYLTSPAWRFVCAAGACGPAPLIGLLVPSVDRVGRYFPLTVVAELPDDLPLVATAMSSSRFLDRVERLVIETLAAARVDFEQFDRGVTALDEELGVLRGAVGIVLDPEQSAAAVQNKQSWQVSIGAASNLGSALGQLLSQEMETRYRPLMLWWSDGSTVVEPSCLVTSGLPGVERYAAFLDGGWSDHQWRSVPARVAEEPTLPGTPIDDGEPLSFRSAAGTDMGKVRSNNEDSFIERTEAGIWAVADGMGGHSHGEVASRMVCDAIAEYQPDGTLDDVIGGVSERVRQVSDLLLRNAVNGEQSGSTVVVLLLRGSRLAILWAGDSRVYRLRGGRLEQLSRDHSLAELEGPAAAGSSIITRAVGVQPDLTLDLVRDMVQADDRFLLCSDGLTRVVPEAQICTLLGGPDVQSAVDGLLKATLAAGAPDNVTVLVAEAYR